MSSRKKFLLVFGFIVLNMFMLVSFLVIRDATMENELKNEMTARDVDELDTGTFKMSYKEVVSNRFDSKAFQKDNEVIYKAYLKESVSKRFTIK